MHREGGIAAWGRDARGREARGADARCDFSFRVSWLHRLHQVRGWVCLFFECSASLRCELMADASGTIQGYTSADITQCGDHCVEVQLAAAHQAEVDRRRREEAREEEDRELATPVAERRR
jgi:hypothetical protein